MAQRVRGSVPITEMSYIELAIKKAFKEGWRPKAYPSLKSMGEATAHALLMSLGDGNILIDPEFWKCLGKAEGWNEGKLKEMQIMLDDGTILPSATWKIWQYHQHRLIDHLSEGKDAESFFEGLLK